MKYVTIIKVGVCQPIPHFDVIEGCSPSGVVTVVSFEPVLDTFDRKVQAVFRFFVLHPVVVLPLKLVNGSSGIVIDQQRLSILKFKILHENQTQCRRSLAIRSTPKLGDDVKDIEIGKEKEWGQARIRRRSLCGCRKQCISCIIKPTIL